MITVEVHPQPGVIFDRIVRAGAAHPVSSFEELRAALDEIPALHERQLAAKDESVA